MGGKEQSKKVIDRGISDECPEKKDYIAKETHVPI